MKCSLACRHSNKNLYALSPIHVTLLFDLTSLNCFLTFRNLLIISHLGALNPRMIFFLFPGCPRLPLVQNIFSWVTLDTCWPLPTFATRHADKGTHLRGETFCLLNKYFLKCLFSTFSRSRGLVASRTQAIYLLLIPLYTNSIRIFCFFFYVSRFLLLSPPPAQRCHVYTLTTLYSCQRLQQSVPLKRLTRTASQRLESVLIFS